MAPFSVFLLVFLKKKTLQEAFPHKKTQPLYLVITRKEIAVIWITVLLFFFSSSFSACQIYFYST